MVLKIALKSYTSVPLLGSQIVVLTEYNVAGRRPKELGAHNDAALYVDHRRLVLLPCALKVILLDAFGSQECRNFQVALQPE